jgi:uncharacterized membrane protein YoaK (UPF0700 family)
VRAEDVLTGIEASLESRPVSDARRRDLIVVALSFAAGAVDAVALLAFGVFTAVMTGNIVLLGIAIGHGALQSAVRSSISLAAYVAGVVVGARVVGSTSSGAIWPVHATRALAIEWALQAAFFAGWIVAGAQPGGVAAAGLIALSGLAMGLQATMTRRLGLGLSTTYITGTLTTLLSELFAPGSAATDAARRGLILLALPAGAVIGAVVFVSAPLLAPAVPLVVIGAVVVVALRSFGPGNDLDATAPSVRA